ncbi:hypothetical protein DFS34DRAFT_620147 [Phlyctochytrium arcticum]|nr:hypothetical protein DFS34DRAFT_620147 [Phlyctochytrium arcticum]
MQPPMPQQHHHQQQPMHQLHVLPDIYQPTRFTSSLFPEFETALSPSTPPVDVDPYGSFRAAVSNPSSIPEEDMSFLDAWPERGFAEHLKSVYNSQAPSGADGAEDSNHFIENDNGDAREDSPTVASGSGTQPAAASEKPSSTFMPINSSAVPIPPTNNRKRRKRDMREVDALCTNCSRRVARLFLHGTEDQFLDPYVVQMKCVVCPSATEDGQASTPIEPTPPATAPTSRKRKAACLAPETRPVNCEVCKRQAAVGGIWRSTDLSANGGADSAKRQATNGKPAEPVGICRLNPPFGVEVVCAPCHEKYTLCSDCGGGGKYRTGKWRPSQLFAANRLTCSLSHERYGAQSSLHTEQWSVVRPGETAVPPTMDPQISPEMISVILEACEDIVLSHSAVAKVMERCPNRSTWEGLQRIVAHLRKNIDEMLNGEDKDLRPGIRRYVNLRWISPKHETSTSDSGSPPCKGWTDCSGRRVIFTVMIGDWNTTTGNMSNFLGVACSGKHRGEAWALMLNSIKADHARMTAEGFNPPPLGWICLNVSCGGRNGQMDTEVAKTLRKQGFLPLPEAPEAAGIATCEDEETTEVVGNFQIWAGRFETILTNSHLV